MTKKTKIEQFFAGIVGRKNNIDRFWRFRQQAIHCHGIKRLFAIYKYYQFMERFGASIPLSTSIKDLPIFPHGLNGIFISSDAKIGSGLTIFHQVTIGSNQIEGSKGKGAPKIGNNVYIGSGAKVIGGITVGNNVRIGANCIVTEDIPDNCTVVLNHPRIIKRKQ